MMETMDLFDQAPEPEPISNDSVTGVLRKMPAKLIEGQPIQYHLLVGEHKVDLNASIGKAVRLEFTGNIYCVHCGEKTNKSFGQGYCYKHFMALAQTDVCIMSPEKCHYDQGTCRDPQWGERSCLQTHYVYLSNASAIKVGITRGGQIPTRWIDQGATQAIAIARVTTRQLAGFIEVAFKKHVADKTNWRAMLKGSAETLDMAAERDRLFALAQADLNDLIEQHGLTAVQLLTHSEPFQLDFPVNTYPEKVTSFNFDKEPVVQGTLMGIKGQYLILNTGVINIRRFGGYEVSFS